MAWSSLSVAFYKITYTRDKVDVIEEFVCASDESMSGFQERVYLRLFAMRKNEDVTNVKVSRGTATWMEVKL